MIEGYDLTGRVAIVTGGGTGIGRDTALLLAERGADVVVAGRRPEPIENTAAEIRALGRQAVAFDGDVGTEDAALVAAAQLGVAGSWIDRGRILPSERLLADFR